MRVLEEIFLVPGASDKLKLSDNAKLVQVHSNSGKYAAFILESCLLNPSIEKEYVLKIHLHNKFIKPSCVCKLRSELIPMKTSPSYERITYTLPFTHLSPEDQNILIDVFSPHYFTPLNVVNFKFRRTVTEEGSKSYDGKFLREEKKLPDGIVYSYANEVVIHEEMFESLERSERKICARRNLKGVRCVEYFDHTKKWDNPIAPYVENVRLSMEIRGHDMKDIYVCVEIEITNIDDSNVEIKNTILSLLPLLVNDYLVRHCECIQ